MAERTRERTGNGVNRRSSGQIPSLGGLSWEGQREGSCQEGYRTPGAIQGDRHMPLWLGHTSSHNNARLQDQGILFSKQGWEWTQQDMRAPNAWPDLCPTAPSSVPTQRHPESLDSSLPVIPEKCARDRKTEETATHMSTAAARRGETGKGQRPQGRVALQTAAVSV